MKKIFSIDEAVASKIIGTMFTHFAELNGACFGCLGMCHGNDSSIHIAHFEPAGVNLKKEIENYLVTVETKYRQGSPILITGTPHSISGVLMEDGSVFCFGSPFGNPYDLAVAVVYAHYHQTKERLGIIDDSAVDALLLHLGRWQEKYAHDNEIIVPLAKAVFKPEVLLKTSENFPGVHRY